MPASVTKEEAEQHFPQFVQLVRHPNPGQDEPWFATWWMGKYYRSDEFHRLVERGSIDIYNDFFWSELFLHYKDWIETLSEEDYQHHLDRLTNLVLF